MNLTDEQIKICKQIVMTFETGKPRGDYSCVAVLADGPGDPKRRQISYGIVQTNEHSYLYQLLVAYGANDGIYTRELNPYKSNINDLDLSIDPPMTILSQNDSFKNLLRQAGSDPIMQKCQDNLVDEKWFVPTLEWCNRERMELPLAAAVIYDSFINSGGVSSELRNTFKECTPRFGGDECTWIIKYVQARREWLELHYPHNVVRMCNFQKLIVTNNWQLTPPIKIYTYENNGFLGGRAIEILGS